VWTVAAVVVLGGLAAASPFLLPLAQQWLTKTPDKDGADDKGDKEDKESSHELVRDARGRPVDPPTIRLSPEAARSLRITPETTRVIATADKPRPLPPLEGTLAYDNASLFPVRPRFAGEVAEITEIPKETRDQEPDFTLPPAKRYQVTQTRPLGFGDHVTRGQVLAVVWSKDLGTAKAALVDALNNLRWSKDTLARETKTYEEGALSVATLRAAERQVRLDTNALLTAERTLRMWKLTDEEIEAIKREAGSIEEAKRDPKKETAWARVEVKAPHDGVIVEKNTNLGDWVDPVNGNPMFRIADLRTLAVWITPMEEYLPVLRKLLEKRGPGRLRWQIRLQAEPHTKPLESPIERIAPSLDPVNHSLLVMGTVSNPEGRLLVGQFITATVFVHPEKDLVEIPTTALNEESGQSLVFVQPDPTKLEFQVRRVAVTDRFKDVVFVRSKVATPSRPRKPAGLRGPWPIRPLEPGERVITQGVPMLTVALRDLVAKEDTQQ
jgi:cobalt-zinc-cadmium efflux system membrane fusion protein